MVRLAVLLVALGGCDVVFMLEEKFPPVACGKYGDITKVSFDPALSPVTEFSINGDGTRGFVQATHAGRTGVTPVKNVDGTWVHDPMFEANLGQLQSSQRLRFGRISFRNELFAAQLLDSGYFAAWHYAFNGTWALANNFPVAIEPTRSTFPGGELELDTPADPSRSLDQIVIIDLDDDARTSISIAAKQPAGMAFEKIYAGAKLSTFPINEVHEPTQGALVRGPNGLLVLAYAARRKDKVTGEPIGSSDIYMSEKDGDVFPVGIPVEKINTNADELEPWVSEDCQSLFFRRGNDILTTAVVAAE